jgi:hypothetical protein
MRKKIENAIKEKEQFIDDMRAFFSRTKDTTERTHRLEIFDTLLLLATYAEKEQLEEEFKKTLPPYQDKDALSLMCKQLRVIHGLCKQSLSNDDEAYQNLFANNNLTVEIETAICIELSDRMTQMILEKTDTPRHRMVYR